MDERTRPAIIDCACISLHDVATSAQVLTSTDDIYNLLLQIADAPRNSDLKVPVTGKTFGGWSAAGGAVVGGVLVGLGAAITDATIGMDTSITPNFKSLPVLLRDASQEDRQGMAEAASSAAISLSIQLTWGLVVPHVTPDARYLLLEVLRSLGYTVISIFT